MEKQSKRPENMPRQVKAEKPKLKKEQGGEALPPQQPLTDEEALPKKTPRCHEERGACRHSGLMRMMLLLKFRGD